MTARCKVLISGGGVLGKQCSRSFAAGSHRLSVEYIFVLLSWSFGLVVGSSSNRSTSALLYSQCGHLCAPISRGSGGTHEVGRASAFCGCDVAFPRRSLPARKLDTWPLRDRLRPLYHLFITNMFRLPGRAMKRGRRC